MASKLPIASMIGGARRVPAHLRAHLKWLAERDAEWGRNRERYGVGMPQYVRPDELRPVHRERWAAEHPRAINVRGGDAAPPSTGPPPEPEGPTAPRPAQPTLF